MKEEPKKPVEQTIAESLIKLADNVAALLSGPLNTKALLILLSASSGLSKGNVEEVLNAIKNLRKDFLN